MQPGASLYCTDFAPKMVEEFEIGFKDSELNNNEIIAFSVLKDIDKINVEGFDSEKSQRECI